MPSLPFIDPDIRRAQTPPSSFYRDPAAFALAMEAAFLPAWHLLPEALTLPHRAGSVLPAVLAPGSLDQPVLLVRSEGGLHCLSNACTHRGNRVVTSPACLRHLRCAYHGRRFHLDGTFASAPGFEGAVDFPSPSDDLPPVPFQRSLGLPFASVSPRETLDSRLAWVRKRVGWLDPERFHFDPSSTREYELPIPWALYCDNYLEGFHIPFVHPGLQAQLDPQEYPVLLFPGGTVQVGIASSGETAFTLPPHHPDGVREVAAWYFWLFPNLMLNYYPWGLSVNVVEPMGPERTRIRYLAWVRDASLRNRGAGANLDRVELEDQEIIRETFRGLSSRFYGRGRYSPAHETGVHHFHRLLVQAMAG